MAAVRWCRRQRRPRSCPTLRLITCIWLACPSPALASLSPVVLVPCSLCSTSTAATAAPAADTRDKCTLLFGTQTGTAERFAKSLRAQLEGRYGGSTAFEALDIEHYDHAARLPKEKLVVLLMATYGDGDPTDSATDFWTWLSEAAEEGAQPDLLQVCWQEGAGWAAWQTQRTGSTGSACLPESGVAGGRGEPVRLPGC